MWLIRKNEKKKKSFHALQKNLQKNVKEYNLKKKQEKLKEICM